MITMKKRIGSIKRCMMKLQSNKVETANRKSHPDRVHPQTELCTHQRMSSPLLLHTTLLPPICLSPSRPMPSNSLLSPSFNPLCTVAYHRHRHRASHRRHSLTAIAVDFTLVAATLTTDEPSATEPPQQLLMLHNPHHRWCSSQLILANRLSLS